jgi:hypothetical protein
VDTEGLGLHDYNKIIKVSRQFFVDALLWPDPYVGDFNAECITPHFFLFVLIPSLTDPSEIFHPDQGKKKLAVKDPDPQHW